MSMTLPGFDAWLTDYDRACPSDEPDDLDEEGENEPESHHPECCCPACSATRL